MKVCSKCKIKQPLDAFRKAPHHRDGLTSACKKCCNKVSMIYYHANKSKYKITRRRLRHSRKQLINSCKNVPCKDCKIKYPYYVMDFDHVRGTKNFLISQAGYGTNTNGTKRYLKSSNSVSVENLILEIEKCDVVCSNCHRERTHKRRISK